MTPIWRRYRLRRHPGFDSVEAWLHRLDSTPRAVPIWPDSQRLSLVACLSEGGGEAEAYVMVDKACVDELFRNSGREPRRTLFFTIPRSYLLDQHVKPDGLEDAWK